MERALGANKTICLVAHDNKKGDLIDWVIFNRRQLGSHQLVATGTTGTPASSATVANECLAPWERDPGEPRVADEPAEGGRDGRRVERVANLVGERQAMVRA